ncbi:MAG: FAD:protein FMN transferase [Chloroflexi bacterium]|nr:FAD:protein FMN transferase [Chloroflexota bacterium]
MDTIVTATVVGAGDTPEVKAALDKALGWFGAVEQVCSRFDRDSEVFKLAESVGQPRQVSPMLFEAVRFSLHVAEATDGAFDPTVGAAQAARGFDRNYVTGERVSMTESGEAPTWRDVRLDANAGTIELAKPLLIDLGAVAKGMAIDLAALELSGFESFSIDAGGDVCVHGNSEDARPWRVGIQHPRQDGLVAAVQMSDGAVCTSGDYERPAETPGEHHLLDPRSGHSPRAAISCSVVAPSAMLADALSTAAFVLGPEKGLDLLDREGVDGLFVTPDLRVLQSRRFGRWLA